MRPMANTAKRVSIPPIRPMCPMRPMSPSLKGRRPAANPRSGFTLMEVLVALAILGTSLFVLVNAHFSAMNLIMDSAEVMDERMLLEGAAARAEIAVMMGNLAASGDFGAKFPGYGWSYQAQQVGVDQAVPLYQVTATLSKPEGSASLDFFVFNIGDPGSSGGGELTGKSSIKRGAAGSRAGSAGTLQSLGGNATRSSSTSSSTSSSSPASRSSRGRSGMFSGSGR